MERKILSTYARQNANFDLQLVDSNEKGYLTLDQEEIPTQTTVYMCGPLPMMKALAKQIKKKNPKAKLIYEGFKFK